LGQVKNISAIQRNFVCLALVNHLAEGRSIRLHQWRLARHFNRLRDLAQCHGQVNARSLLHFNDDVRMRGVLEAGLLGVYAVAAWKQVHKLVQTIRAGGLSALFTCALVGQRDLHIGNGAAAGISYGS